MIILMWSLFWSEIIAGGVLLVSSRGNFFIKKINVDQIQKHLKRGGSWGSNGWQLFSLADRKINIQAVKLTYRW